MMTGFMTASLIVGVLSALVCAGFGVFGENPNDITIVSAAVVEIFLIAYAIVRAVGAFSGNGPRGPLWEFWGYALTAVIIPVGVIYWALVERTRWSNFILAAAGLVSVVMVFRMEQLWLYY